MLKHYFPNLLGDIEQIVTDPRRKASCEYRLSCLVMGCVMMYLLRLGSRNGMNNERDSQEFRLNFHKMLGVPIPHMDTVDKVLRRISSEQFERLQQFLVRQLLEKRVFHKFRLENKYFIVAIDGTGVFKFDELPYSGCPYKKSKKGKRTYSQNVVEAKLLCANGFSISLGQEWMNNEDGHTKQDCEYKATLRLIEKLKKLYPRLPICLVMDGLFLKHPLQKAIKDKGWEFIMVWKDKTLYGLQDEIELRKENGTTRSAQSCQVHNQYSRSEYKYDYCESSLNHKGLDVYSVTGLKIDYDLGEDASTTTKFHFMTSLPITSSNYRTIFEAGRLRWKIENEGFNAQKNQGYNLHHKMNRKNLSAIKNYYICLQVAHLFSQLMSLANNSIVKTFDTLKYMWITFVSLLRMITDYHPIPLDKKYNLRY
ncbi:MAG: transposase family protein [Thermodesulfobacteriota bacterium]